MISTPPSATATPRTPAEPNGHAAVLRFRERVRARCGSAELLAFRAGGERFAFDVRALDHAVDTPPLEASPLVSAGGGAKSPPSTDGVTVQLRQSPGMDGVFRGIARLDERSIPVFDTARLLGATGATTGAQLLVMRSGARRIGLLADDVDDVVTIDLASIKPSPVDAGDELLLGVTWDGEEVTGILDARALIASCQQRTTEAKP